MRMTKGEEVVGDFTFKVGQTYKCQNGELVKVLGRTDLKHYECLICDDNRHRYDRSSSNSDDGRVCGTAHDYSHPFNFEKENK